METIKEELDINVKAEATLRNRDGPSPLWEGEVKVKLEKENREIQIPVQIFHKDDAKNGQKLFDWTIGKKLFITLSITTQNKYMVLFWLVVGVEGGKMSTKKLKVELSKSKMWILPSSTLFREEPVKKPRAFLGSAVVGAIKYPMALLGSKSKPQLKHLKPFIKVAFFIFETLADI